MLKRDKSAAQVRRQLLARQGTTLEDRVRARQLHDAVQVAATKEKRQRAERELKSFMEALKA